MVMLLRETFHTTAQREKQRLRKDNVRDALMCAAIIYSRHMVLTCACP